MDPALAALIDDLRATRFRDLAGARVTAHVPIGRDLLNRLVAGALSKANAPVRQVTVTPQRGDRFELLVSLKWSLVPPVRVTVDIEQQPAFPASPGLVLRWSLPRGLGAIASQFVGGIKSLPPGVRLEADRVLIDLRAVAGRGPASEVLPYVNALALHTIDDAAIVDVELGVATRA